MTDETPISANNDSEVRPDGLESLYELGDVDPDIVLSEDEVVLGTGDRSVSVSPAKLVISSRPKLGLRFCGTARGDVLSNTDLVSGQWQPDRLTVGGMSGSGLSISHCSINPMRPQDGAALSGQLNELTAGTGQIRRVVFHVPNLRRIHGSLIQRGATSHASRLELIGMGWRVLIDGRGDLDDVQKQLISGSYAITHVGALERQDGSSFSVDQAEGVLDALHWFLSFVQGFWVCPLLIHGLGDEEATVWRKWNVGRTDRNRGVLTWSGPMGLAASQQTFTRFIELWAQPFTNSVLRIAVGQYVSANDPDPVEVAIIVAQSGLELLGWTEFVESGQIGKGTWKRMEAQEKITRLLAVGNIDPAIPSTTPTLVGIDPNWKTGPQAVAGMRNRLVHPSNRDGSATWPGDALADAWTLSTYYLELMLLHRLGVTEQVHVRIDPSYSNGAKHAPPWAGGPSSY